MTLDANVICSRPECKTTAGCQCSQMAQAMPLKLRRRPESITAQEVLDFFHRGRRDGGQWGQTITDIEYAIKSLTV